MACLLKLSAVITHHVGPINLALNSGELAMMSGPSGCGKSLLLRAIADLDEHQGNILLDNTPQTDIPAPIWRSQVGYLAEESHWWAATVGEHFTQKPDELLAKLGFSQTCLDWDIHRLSSGERQRLAFVRLLLMKPRALLLDEPTSNLDQENTLRIENMVTDYLAEQQAAAIWVSHDSAQQERLGDSRYRMEQGALSAWS